MSDQETFLYTATADDGETMQHELTAAQALDHSAGSRDISKAVPIAYWTSNVTLREDENGELVERHVHTDVAHGDDAARKAAFLSRIIAYSDSPGMLPRRREPAV